MLVVFPLWAAQEARLLKRSQSGQSAVFNLGSFDGVKEGDFAVVVKKIRDLDLRDLRVVPVARARNVKINTDSSVWFFHQVFDYDLLHEGDQYLILSEEEMLKGRKGPELGRLTVVANNSEEAIMALKDDQGRLQKLGSKYAKGEKLHGKSQVTNNEGELVDVESWEKVKGERYRQALYKSPTESEFLQKIRLDTFQKIVTAYMRKINDPDFNYDAFYEDVMREQKLNEFKRTSYNKSNVAEPHMNAPFNAEQDKRRASMAQNGEAWSQDYSDEELSQALRNTSIFREKIRRELRETKPTRYAINVDLGFNLSDAQTDKSNYQRDTRYSLEGSFEATPFLGDVNLEKITLFGGLRKNNTAFDMGNGNAAVDEISLSFGANWYPLYAPYIYEAPVVFVGTFLRTGYATVRAPTVSESSRYSVVGIPGFQGGVKYLFRNRFGVRALASMETLNLNNFSTVKAGTSLPANAKFIEGKVGFGMTYIF